MNPSTYFLDLRSVYQSELDDLTSDSEGKDVLRKRLAEKRKAAGISPVAAGEKMGKSETQIYRYESGATRTDTPLLAEFAKLYGCKVEDFVTGIEGGK